ncbi:hypothetical protein [Methylobacterium sp. D48H]
MPILTRQEAAAEMVDAAIGHWLDGRLACAITLAGAAEDGMPRMKPGASMFEMHRQILAKVGKCSPDEAGRLLRTDKNWLKHFSEDKPETISTDEAWSQVFRAYLHFRSVYPTADRTENMKKLDAKIFEHVAPFLSLAQGIGTLVQGLMKGLAQMFSPKG